MLRKLFLACCGSDSHNSSETHLDRSIKKKNSRIKRGSVFLNSNSISILCKEGTLDHLNPASVSYSVSSIWNIPMHFTFIYSTFDEKLNTIQNFLYNQPIISSPSSFNDIINNKLSSLSFFLNIIIS